MTNPPISDALPNLLDSDGINREALKQAWAQFSIYDETAKNLKRGYIIARQRVIQLTLIGTVAAIGAGVFKSDDRLWQVLVYSLGFFAVAAPSLASYILRDALQFIGQTEWVHNRYIAERLRQQIYHYRTKSGGFAGKQAYDADDILSGQIREIRDEMRNKITLPPAVKLADIKAKSEAELNAEAQADGSKSKAQKKLAALKFDDYVKERVIEQINWYDKKVYDAFERKKYYFRASQFALLVGALFGAVVGIVNPEVILIIAITNALSESIMSWSDVTLSGATYSVFSLTSQKLNDMHLENTVNQTRSASAKGDITEINTTFINNVEKILEWERNEWYEHVLRTQAEVDNRILNQLNKFLEDEQSNEAMATDDGSTSEDDEQNTETMV